jgi:uncharacterized sulfatase
MEITFTGDNDMAQQPNFVFIMTDTQATNVIGAYGLPELQTPNIDRLAQTGIKFDNAYTTCPLCTPARAGIFTGIYPHTAGAWTNNLPLGDNIKTMGQRFEDNGYNTAYIGKWHLDGHDYFGTGECPVGWNPDFWYDGRNYLNELSESEITMWRQHLNSLADLTENHITADFTWAHRVGDRAIRFLGQQSDRPFLLVVSYDEPHHPFTAPPEYVKKFQQYEYPLGPGAFDSLENKPSHQKEWAAASNVSRRIQDGMISHPMYFGCNSFVDAEIGRVIDAVHTYIADKHISENTYIIFTSDHGDMLGTHQLSGKGPVMYEEIAHIPLIIEPPGGGIGYANNTVVSHIDLLPTMLELADIECPPILEGNSLKSQLEGRIDTERTAVIEFQRYEIEHDSWGGFQPVRCIVDQRYKLVINLLSSDELYDLGQDKAEVHNLINEAAFAQTRNQMHDKLLDWMYEKRDPFRGPVWERRPWRESRRYKWQGNFRPRPADGYATAVRDYDTGLPTKGVKIEYGGQKKTE